MPVDRRHQTTEQRQRVQLHRVRPVRERTLQGELDQVAIGSLQPLLRERRAERVSHQCLAPHRIAARRRGRPVQRETSVTRQERSGDADLPGGGSATGGRCLSSGPAGTCPVTAATASCCSRVAFPLEEPVTTIRPT